MTGDGRKKGLAFTGWVAIRRGPTDDLVNEYDLDPVSQLIMLRLAIQLHSEAEQVRLTYKELCELVNVSDPKGIRDKVRNLADLGLLKVDAVRGQGAAITVLWRDRAVEDLGPAEQRGKSPLRGTPGHNGDSPPLRDAGDLAPHVRATGKIPVGCGENPLSDQGPPLSLSTVRAAPSARHAADPWPPADSARARDRHRGAARRPGPPGSVTDRAPLSDSTPSEHIRAAGAGTVVTADGSRRAVREEAEAVFDLEGPRTSSTHVLDTGSRADAEVAAANSQASPGLRERDPRATAEAIASLAAEQTTWPATGTEGR